MGIFRKFNQLGPDDPIPWYLRAVSSPIGPYYFSMGWHGKTKAEFERTCGKFARIYIIGFTIFCIVVISLMLSLGILWLMYRIAVSGTSPSAESLLFFAFIGSILAFSLVMALLRIPMVIYIYHLLDTKQAAVQSTEQQDLTRE